MPEESPPLSVDAYVTTPRHNSSTEYRGGGGAGENLQLVPGRTKAIASTSPKVERDCGDRRRCRSGEARRSPADGARRDAGGLSPCSALAGSGYERSSDSSVAIVCARQSVNTPFALPHQFQSVTVGEAGGLPRVQLEQPDRESHAVRSHRVATADLVRLMLGIAQARHVLPQAGAQVDARAVRIFRQDALRHQG